MTKFHALPVWWLNNRADELDFSDEARVSSGGRFRQVINNVGLSEDLPAFGVQIEAKGYDSVYSPKVYPGQRLEPFVIRLKRIGATTKFAKP